MGTQVLRIEQSALADQFMPVFSMDQAIMRRQAIIDATVALMHRDVDYGIIPGTPKPTLLKPGAEKLCTLFGLSPAFMLDASVEDWTGQDHGGEAFFYYRYKCQLARGRNIMGEGDGSCNTWESKYRYRWVLGVDIPPGLSKERLRSRDGTISEFVFAVDKADTGGKYGKPPEYWQRFKDAIAAGEARKIERDTKGGRMMFAWEIGATVYRVPNPDVCDQVNTVQKMAQKRAMIAATLIAVNASEFYTQDLDDLMAEGIDTGGHPAGTKEAAQAVGERKVAEARAQQAPPPEPAPVEVINQDVIALWKRMKDKTSCIAEFAVIKDRLAALGKELDYYRILELAGVRHANQFAKLEDARKAAEKMIAAAKEAESLMVTGAEVPA